MRDFRQFEFWKRSVQLAVDLYSVTQDFPDDEKFGMTSQLRRASVSVASNIAEGASRRTNKDFARFLEIAIGSAHEIETQLEISSSVGLIPISKGEEMRNEVVSIIRLITKYKVKMEGGNN